MTESRDTLNGDQSEDAPELPTTARISFTVKICIHITLITLVLGLSVMGFVSYGFKHELFKAEYNAAFNAYAAAASYLRAHFKSHRGRFHESSLDFVFSQKFMRLEGVELEDDTYRPVWIAIYDEDSEPIYSYEESMPLVTSSVFRAVAELPPSTVYHQSYNRDLKTLHVSGPIMEDDELICLTSMIFLSDIEKRVGDILKQILSAIVLAMIFTIGTSVVFARRILSPVQNLTKAARSVHEGDLHQRVPVKNDDEIGELCSTFNEMVEALSRRLTLMHRLQEWTVRLSRRLHKERIYNILSEMFTSLTHSVSYRLYLYNPKTDSLEVCLERGGEALLKPEDDALSRRALEERWTQYLKTDGSINSEPNDVAELAVPLLSGQTRIGVIRVGPTSDSRNYTDEMLTTLQTIAQQSSIALDNANLYEQLSEKERIEQEMQLARDIQQAMLPRKIPVIPGYDVQGGSSPAYEVGGDYFDYLPSSDGRWHFMIADVSGKGVPAAMIMSILRSLLHTYLEFETSPATIMSKINRRISKDVETGTFITVTELALDNEKHAISVARAGHEPVVRITSDGKIEHISPPGPGVGLLDVEVFDEIIEEEEYSIAPGETLVMYTDGITEALNAADEEFGVEKLEEVLVENRHLSVKGLYIKIIEEVCYFSASVPQSDDRTLVIVRRLDERQKSGTMKVPFETSGNVKKVNPLG